MDIEIKDVHYSYDGKVDVLRNLNLSLEKGKTYGVLGHNGAGKTTLLRLISKLFEPTSGSVEVERDIDISYMPYNDALYPELSAFQNIKFRSQCYLQDEKEFSESANTLMEKFNILDIKDKKVSTLSSGLKKRVSIICACIAETQLILLDEPTNGIDPETFIIMTNFIKDLKSKGITIVVNSHNLDFISSIADEIIILAHGELTFKETFSEISTDIEDVYLKYCKGVVENIL